jgi:hypothetical protein
VSKQFKVDWLMELPRDAVADGSGVARAGCGGAALQNSMSFGVGDCVLSPTLYTLQIADDSFEVRGGMIRG